MRLGRTLWAIVERHKRGDGEHLLPFTVATTRREAWRLLAYNLDLTIEAVASMRAQGETRAVCVTVFWEGR